MNDDTPEMRFCDGCERWVPDAQVRRSRSDEGTACDGIDLCEDCCAEAEACARDIPTDEERAAIEADRWHAGDHGDDIPY